MKQFIYGVVGILFGISTGIARAEGLITCGSASSDHACTYKDILPTINNILTTTLTTIVMPILAVLIIFGGYKMITAGENAGKFQEGLKMIKGVAWGFGFALLAWIIVRTLTSFLGI